MEPHKDLKTLLDEALELKNVNHEKLAQVTGIPERYIWALHNMAFDKLPAAPYVRGYIQKISETLHLNHDELWELYKKELEHKTSGVYDTLPVNRFAIRHLSRKTLFFIALGMAIIIYTVFNLNRIIGQPNLFVTSPNESVTTASNETFLITGTLNQRDKLSINGREVFI